MAWSITLFPSASSWTLLMESLSFDIIILCICIVVIIIAVIIILIIIIIIINIIIFLPLLRCLQIGL